MPGIRVVACMSLGRSRCCIRRATLMRCCRGGVTSKCAATWAMARSRGESGWLSVLSSRPMVPVDVDAGVGGGVLRRSAVGQKMHAVNGAGLSECVAGVLPVCQ